MSIAKIVWVDDEIESLKSQKIFLEQKGYEVQTFTNGFDAIEYLKENTPDVVLLDESMPGVSGLETLAQIKNINQQLPAILVTKNETENLMEEAIGNQIADYLIKPVNPNQVLLSLKKILDNKRLVAEKTTTAYQQEFNSLFTALSNNPNYNEWKDIYKKLVYWELEMEKSNSPEMQEVLQTQKQEANTEFYKFISKNYSSWIQGKTDRPVMSFDLLKEKVFPLLEKDKPLFFVLIDNFRFDQWKTVQPLFSEDFKVVSEDMFYSILPTATQYCRNATFAGMMPLEIEKNFPDKWINDEEEGGKNLHEEEFLAAYIGKLQKKNIKFSYTKIVNNQDAQLLVNNIRNLLNNDLNIIVYNFVDMLSHARTEMEVLKELASNEISYRSITKSWFEHSPLKQALKKIADKNITLVLSTDHGSVKVRTPNRIIGDKQTSTNLRYKTGRNLQFNPKEGMVCKNPKEIGLPTPGVNSSFVFAKEDGFLCYPTNYNYYVNYFKNTFQHGGISMEEIMAPIIRMESK
jgi:CheY-like chemotaxis protein